MSGALVRRTAAAVAAALVLTACVTSSGSATTTVDGSATGAPGSHARGSVRALVSVPLRVPASNRSGTFTSARRVRVPRGWHASVWALVPGARLEAWSPAGDLLVSEPGNGTIVELLPRHNRAAAPRQRVVISGLNQPQGMAFDRLHGHEVLYVAETDAIDRYSWRGHSVGARRILIPSLPSGDDHTLKNVVVARNHDIYFDIGSTSNASPPPTSRPPWASVMKYAPSGRKIRVWARGVRNGDGLSFAPDGSLWTAVNGRDDIAYPFHRRYGSYSDAYGQVIPAYVDNHPPDQIAQLTPGRNLGWPYCNPDPDVHRGATRTAFRYGSLPFDDDVQTNPGGRVLRCGRLTPLNLGLPAHSAPLGFHFLNGSRLPTAWRDGAVVATHGSWDREPPRPPGVLWMPWQGRTHTLGRAITLMGGFQGRSGNRWGRTVDAVPGPDGALYVSDDTAGAIYRLVPPRG